VDLLDQRIEQLGSSVNMRSPLLQRVTAGPAVTLLASPGGIVLVPPARIQDRHAATRFEVSNHAPPSRHGTT